MTMPSLTHRSIQKSLAFVSCFWVMSCGVLFADVGISTLNGDFKALTLSGSRIVAIDLSTPSEILTSDDDGGSFTTRMTAGPLDRYEALAAVGSTVVAVGIDGLVLRSGDSGTSWSAASAPSLLGALYSVAGRSDGENPNQWLSVGDDGFDGSVYRSTDDGLNWTAHSITGVLLEDVIWTGNRWLLCGRDDFNEGALYSSVDGLTWSASTVPVASSPLLAMTHDGSGGVVAVGESGQVLRSTDDGLTFSVVAADLFSGDINAVAYASDGTFYLGGDEKAVIRLNGSNASFLIPPAAQATPVLEIILIGNVPFAAGAFAGVQVRTIPLDLLLTTGGTLDYRLSVSQALSGKTYFLETSTDLTSDWTPLPSSSQLGNGGPIFFDVSEEGSRRFWRVAEF